MANTTTHNLHATVEDYDSDQSVDHVLRENFNRKSATPPAQANVSTKRSKDLNQEQASAQEKMTANIDLRSDSGYSSYTGISKSSADSAPSATSRSPPVMPTTTAPAPAPSPAPKPRRPTGGESRQYSNESSPRQKLARTASSASKRPAGQRRPTVTKDPEECTDPNCTQCGPNVKPRRRPTITQPSQSTQEIPRYPQDQRSVQSDPYYAPSSPTYLRHPGSYMQGAAVVEPGFSVRRPSSSRPRPQSFAGDPSTLQWQQGMPMPGYPSPPHERGPPPASSAHFNSAYQQHRAPHMQHGVIPSYMPQQQGGPYYNPALQAAPAFEHMQRPSLSARVSSNNGARGFPAAINTQDDTTNYSARFGQPPTPIEPKMPKMNRMPKPKLIQYQDEEVSETESSEYEEDAPQYDYDDPRAREERRLMPPPVLKRNPSQSRRPTLTRPNTYAQERPRDSRRQSIVVDRPAPRDRERERERAPRPPAPSRRASVSRPPMHRQSQSEYDTQPTRVVVNNSSKPNRRQSYQTTEKAHEEYERQIKARERARAFEEARILEEQVKAAAHERDRDRKRERRASRTIVVDDRDRRRHMPGGFDDEDDDLEEEERPVARPSLRSRRRPDTSDLRMPKERAIETKSKKKEMVAEDYINNTRGAREPIVDEVNRAAKRASRMPSMPSESGSSNGSGKASQSNRTTMTGNTNNEIRLRIQNGSAPVNLQISGEMEGRTLQLVPAENGATDLVIGGTRGDETVYHSELGSQRGNNRRSIVAGQGRRDAEEASERSSRTDRSRRDRGETRESRDDRDGRGHVLRRSRNTTYY
ncbi:hypothetical protein EK21DRAFT_110275 [Setomelanomma holmii]|uniref:Uncharacterized protein n=1 Tax=Setomelanomma holmii TaxID=210430 RepID=A0A9P4HEY8_9PLEO|nr:hypothetical protein EK21DRAFT_110275 [Setomelanomma holmii]